jgi:acyl-CoA reductase-like NAD-dependent aldehyde dehydrogenase
MCGRKAHVVGRSCSPSCKSFEKIMYESAIHSPLPARISVTNPFTGVEVGTVPSMPASSASMLIDVARRGAQVSRNLSRHERGRVLNLCASLIERDRDAFADLISAEAGKTIKQARKEVLRCVITLRLSADEARHNAGEIVPFDAYAGSEDRQGWFTREPLGIILAITPYNDPLNLVAHKLGPALAGGNAVILKPSELTPLSAVKLVSYLVDAGMPPGVVTVATGGVELGQALVCARDVRMISFTGGFATAEKIARSAGLKKLAMDLGGNAAVIVLGDCILDDAVESCVSGAFWAAGQNCVSTQRILVQASIYDEFKSRFVERANRLKAGDPILHDTDVGPMINASSAAKTKSVVDVAIEQGATLLCGNSLKGAVYCPTVLENVSFECDLWNHEVFSPVAVLQRIETLDEALTLANSSEYSLHAGIFTSNLHAALQAAKQLEASGVMINDSSDYRIDSMPFGGFKYGSLGREGVRFAFEEMTQTKVVCIKKTRTQPANLIHF